MDIDDNDQKDYARACEQSRAHKERLISLDYPHTREWHVCPICNREKDSGLLVCWTCYRAHNLRNSILGWIAKILNDTERQLSGRTKRISIAP